MSSKPKKNLQHKLDTLVAKYFRSISRCWLARIAVRRKIKLTTASPLGCTDGKDIFINIENAEKYDEAFQFGLITHELWHIVLKHCLIPEYLRNMQKIRWDEVLAEFRVRGDAPKSVAYLTQYLSLGAEDAKAFLVNSKPMHTLYNAITDSIINETIELPTHPKGFGSLPAGKPPESERVTHGRALLRNTARKYIWPKVGKALALRYLEEILQEDLTQPNNNTSLTSVSPDNFRLTEEELEKVYDMIPSDAHPSEAAEEGGEHTTSRATGVAVTEDVPQYWSGALQRYLVSRLTKGAGKTTVNRRKLPRDIYKQQHHMEQKLLNISIMMDVSGSIDQSMINKFYGNVHRIVKEMTPEKLSLVTWDTRILDEVHYGKGEALPKQFPLRAHGGGTDIGCVGYWLQEKRKQAVMPNTQDLVIIFTDMAFHLPQIEATFPDSVEVIWAAFQIYKKEQAIDCITDLPQHAIFELKEK